MRKWFAIIWLAAILSGISAMFYHMQWIYGLPTPVPASYRQVDLGQTIDLGFDNAGKKRGKPLMLHFFNPDCPCSRFNVPHFKSLVKQFGNEIDFAIVPVTSRSVTAKEIQDKFDLDIPVLLDSTIAVTCGVYSTPQAAVINLDHTLYYRGNYNKSRYCSDKRTEYARVALEALLNSDTTQTFDPLALKAYGCRVPLCTTK
jgi:hypothetical protein